MRELNFDERLAIHEGKGILVNDAMQRIVDAIPAVTGYTFDQSEVVFTFADGRGVRIPFGENGIPTVIHVATIEGIIDLVRERTEGGKGV